MAEFPDDCPACGAPASEDHEPDCALGERLATEYPAWKKIQAITGEFTPLPGDDDES